MRVDTAGQDGSDVSASGERPRVGVCVITYRRPGGLAQLLESLAAQSFRAAAPEVEVLVVDNDASGSARAIVEEARSACPWPLRYEVEPRRGIPVARNAALETVAGRVDYVAMVDDDERVPPNWLEELLGAAEKFDAPVVTGPVLPMYRDGVPRWVREAGFFEPTRRESGSERPYAWCNNVLVHTSVLDRLDRWFDEAFVGTKGEDVEFFLRVRQVGHRIVWADRAVAYEWVTERRGSLGWLLRRHWRNGINNARLGRRVRRAERATHDGRTRPARWLANLRDAFSGLARSPRTWRSRLARVLALFSLAAGFAAGRLGVRFHEYGGRVEDPVPAGTGPPETGDAVAGEGSA